MDPYERLRRLAADIDDWMSEGRDFLEQARQEGIIMDDRLTGLLGSVYARGADLIQKADEVLKEMTDSSQREVIEATKKSFSDLLSLLEEFGKLPRSRS